MQSTPDRLKELFDRWADNRCTPAEEHELMRVIVEVSGDEALEPILQAAWERTDNDALFSDNQQDLLIQQILSRKRASTQDIGYRKLRLVTAHWFRYAAIILLIAGTAAILYLKGRPAREVADTRIERSIDISPGGNKAMLTLGDGRTIVLDSASNGTVAKQGKVQVLKLAEGKLAYQGNIGGETMYNTISTPKGGQYQITLPDGTNIWLNAASSVRFPTAFNGSERRISITGEVYIEVKKDARLPFYVSGNGTEIEVLGTSFNINAYADEKQVTTTLIDGAVRVHVNNRSQKLGPGQQLNARPDGEMQVTGVVNLNRVLAWKNGIFDFQGASLDEAMRQIGRWYDIEVVYEKGIPDIQLGGKMSRGISLNGLLKGLKGAEVNFRLENKRRLVILPSEQK